ncbi:conserved hypothetical protein, partial [Ricinus communis]
ARRARARAGRHRRRRACRTGQRRHRHDPGPRRIHRQPRRPRSARGPHPHLTRNHMKPLDQFLKQMMASAQRVQANDAAGATDIIQRALRDAGLMPSPAQPAPDGPAAFVDLNAAPPWAARPPSGRGARMRRAPADTTDSTALGRFVDGVFACSAGT